MSMNIHFQKDNKLFHQDILKKVKEYFEATGVSDKANWFMYFKSFFYLGVLTGAYLLLILGGFSLWINNLLWIVIGLSSVFTAVNVGHDAIHGSYSKRKWVNKLMGHSFSMVGANPYIWSKTHNIVHHTYTNIDGHDEDIESVPFARLSPSQKWLPIQKYQYIWLLLLYPLGTLAWVFKKDYVKFFQKQIGNYNNSHHPKREYFYLFFFKLLYYFIFIAVPIMLIDMPWYVVFGGFVLGHLFEGFAIAIIFMLAHVVEKAQFPVPESDGLINYNWAVFQMHTTANFGRDSWLTAFLTGGLNFQIEHHLFPNVSHVHYPEISKIIEKSAKEHDVPYYDYPSFYDAFKSHVRLLKALGANTV